MKGTCEKCEHYCALSSECRVEGPKGYPVPTQQGMRIISVFPPVEKDWWCGKFSPEISLEYK